MVGTSVKRTAPVENPRNADRFSIDGYGYGPDGKALVDWYRVTRVLTGNPEIEVQPCPTASTGFHSGVRRASSAVTRYVSFKEGTAKFDTQLAVFGHKTASDTKGA